MKEASSLHNIYELFEYQILETYLVNFYLWTLTMSTVGYGDSVSMPELDSFISDYYMLTFNLLASILGFFLC